VTKTQWGDGWGVGNAKGGVLCGGFFNGGGDLFLCFSIVGGLAGWVKEKGIRAEGVNEGENPPNWDTFGSMSLELFQPSQ